MPDHDAAPDDAIRRYLLWLTDPTSIVDSDAIDAAERAAKESTDVLERLKALSRIDRLRAGDTASVKRAFLDHAKQWGEDNDISPTSWIRLGVPPDVLREAGITGNRAAVRASAPASRAAEPRAAGVSMKQIAAHVETLSDPFVLTDVSDSVGGSPMTVRKAVEQLVADGKVERIGPDPEHNGRGRAPIRYRTVGW